MVKGARRLVLGHPSRKSVCNFTGVTMHASTDAKIVGCVEGMRSTVVKPSYHVVSAGIMIINFEIGLCLS